MRRRTVTLLALVGLLSGLAVMVLVLVYSPLGVSVLHARLGSLLPGVEIERMEGTLGGGFSVHGLHYENERVRLDIANAKATPRLFGSIAGSIGIAALEAEGVRLALKPAANEEGRAPPGLPAIDADGIKVRDAKITLADGRVLRVDSLSGGFASSGTTIRLRSLQLRGPDGRIDGDLAFDIEDLLPRSGKLRADLRWDGQRYVVALVSGKGEAGIRTVATLDSPLRGTATIEYPARDPGRRWRAKLAVPRQQVALLPEAIRDQPFALDLSLAGDGGKLAISGSTSVAGRELRITKGNVDVEPKVLRVRDLTIQEVGRPGRVGITGTVGREDDALALDVVLEGVDPQWEGQVSRIDGTVAVGGMLSALQLRPQLRVAIAEHPAVDVSGSVTVGPEAFVLEPLELLVAEGGRLVAKGSVPRAGDVPWKLQVEAEDFDPGVLLKGFEGKLDGSMEASFEGTGGELAGNVAVEHLEGELRGRAVTAEGTIGFAGGVLVAADFSARSGTAVLTVSGDDTAGRPLVASLSAPTLGDIAPGWQGAAEASVTRVEGAVHDFSLNLERARLGDLIVDELQAEGRFDQETRLPLSLTLTASGVELDQRKFETVRAEITGEGESLRGELDATAGTTRVELAARGTRVDDAWSGVIERLDLATSPPTTADETEAPPTATVHAALEAPAPWRWQGPEWSIAPLCLAAEGGRACVDLGYSDAGGVAQGTFERLPIAPLLALWQPGFSALGGEISGTAKVRWSDAGLQAARIDLRSEQGRVTMPERAEVEFGYHSLAFMVDWTDQGGSASLQADLDPTGRIDGRVSCSGASVTDCALQGQIDARIDDLAWLDALTPDLMDTQGRASGRLLVSGTPAAPLLSGNIRVEDFVGYLPRLSLKLQRGELTLEATQDRALTVDGAVWSGDARLHLGGKIDPAHPEATVLELTGENVLISNTPDTRVRATPDLELRRRDDEWQLTGRILVPEARIDVTDREVTDVRSNDVVVLDDPPRDPRSEQPWNANVTVVLGEDVRVEGLGFDGKVKGEVAIRQRRDTEAIATGQIAVTGRYEAYGQRLKITRGQLLYTNSPLDNPALSIRAERELREAVAGVDVSGTALQPEMRVYSRPAMSETDALAMLVTGRRLSQLSGSESGQLGTAAMTLGTVGGDMLAQSVGASTGFEGTAFSFGRYISPRLYVGYGVGLLTRGEIFTVRFRLTERFEIEAQSGAEDRAALNYRIER